MADILVTRLAQRADELTAAYTANEVAFAAYERAEAQWAVNKCEQNAHALVTTEAAWEDTRDDIFNKAQYLLGTLSILLASAPTNTHPALVQQAQRLKDAFHAEAVAFNRYSHARGEPVDLRQKWMDTRGEIASIARPLVGLVRTMLAPNAEAGA